MAMTTITPASNAYLKQYLKVASEGHVYISYYTFGVGLGEDFNRFKCDYCKDNFAVKDKLFWDNAVPQELQDWVKLHRHPKFPCKTFQYKDAIAPSICICGFNKNVHDFECMKCGLITKGQTVCSSCTLADVQNWAQNWAPGKIIEVPDPIAVIPGYIDYAEFIAQLYKKPNTLPVPPAPTTATLPEHKGRKFRA